MMDVTEYFKSLANELDALKNRVRYLVRSKNWVAYGEWKESVLRATLRRHLPATVGVGRGFVVGLDGRSRQIDILLYDTSKPILHRDGDLVFVTADGVKGIIEVKSSVDNNKLSKALKILADNSEFIYGNLDGISHGDLFVGLFAYMVTSS